MRLAPSCLELLSSPRRAEILRLTWDDFVAAGDIHRAMPDVTFGAVSLHLGQLHEAGLVERRADGRQRLYRARRDALGPLATVLEDMWSDALWKLRIAAEMEAARRGPRSRRRTRRTTS